jgi:hypothetical protein
MQIAEVANQKLDYLGSIDDKVVQYQQLKHPEQQLLRSLFFSTILGDPVVLNDGYLLHSRWGRQQLIDPNSAVRQLNKQSHLLLLARSSEPYSVWIQEQATKTTSYRSLLSQLRPDELEMLDEAWGSCIGTSWPTLNLQTTMLNMLNSASAEVLKSEISPAKLHQHRRLFDARIDKGETVRAAWEAAMLEITAFSDHEQSIMMEFANEAYHASFACGFAGGGQGVDVGIAGYGRQRLSQRNAYQEEDGESLAALLRSEKFRKSQTSLRDLATVYVTRNEKDLFSGDKLIGFLAKAAPEKAAYRSSLQALLRAEAPTQELIDSLEGTLFDYRKVLYDDFGVKDNPAILQVLDLARLTVNKLSEHKDALAVTSNLIGLAASQLPMPVDHLAKVLGNYGEDTLNIIDLGVPVVTNLYQTLQRRRRQEVSLLPQLDKSAYALALDPDFVRDATHGVPSFSPSAR